MNIRALSAVLPLTGEMAYVAAEDLEAMGESAGAAEEAYGKMADMTEAKTQKLQNRLEMAQDEISDGMTPAMLAAW